ncbi:hypothetical protein LSAT2_027826 [Lamellibrachia satsuma]|nr:hypothetical protein LSAT2_027826 [Lamellibrachia satsuma]
MDHVLKSDHRIGSHPPMVLNLPAQKKNTLPGVGKIEYHRIYRRHETLIPNGNRSHLYRPLGVENVRAEYRRVLRRERIRCTWNKSRNSRSLQHPSLGKRPSSASGSIN